MYKTFAKYIEVYKGLYAKIVLIMRLTTILLIASLMQVSASTFGQQITLSKRNVSIESALKEIREQSGYDFFFDGKSLPKDKVIDVALTNASIDAALKSVLRGLPFTYSIEGKIISIRKNEQPSSGDAAGAAILNIDVRGRVVDEEGNPLVGATIRVKGGGNDIITDENGRFILQQVAENATIQISYVGYYRREVKAAPNLGDIRLEMLSSDVEEVEVSYSTGYQNLSRERSAGSFSKPNVNIMKNRSSSVNVLQRLDGLVPGLTVNNGVTAEPLLIRGLTSINSTRAPLVVVDGVELQGVDIESVNMQDVEDITVLKDASSASIWGAKAANGVIVITTKKGRANQKLQIDYDGYYNVQGRPDRGYLNRMNSREFIQTAREIFPLFQQYNPWSSVESVSATPPHLNLQYAVERGLMTQAQVDAKLDSLARVDNFDQISNYIYRNSTTSNHTVSVSGGGSKHTFYGSVNYIGMKNDTPGDKDNRFKINLRQDLDLGKNVRLYLVSDVGTTNTASTNLRTLTSQNTLGYTPISPATVPYQLLADENGKPLPVHYMGGLSDSQRLDYQGRSRINLDYVPLDEINRGHSNGTGISARIVGGGRINLYKGLRFEGTYGYNVSSTNNRAILNEDSYTVRNEVMTYTQAPNLNSTPIYFVPKDGGRLTESNSLVKNWTVRNQLIYDRDWQGVHQLTFLAGQEATSTTPMSTRTIYRGWDDQLQVARPVDYQTLGLGVTGTVTGGTRRLGNNISGGEGVISRTTSYYSNVNYSYLRKYTVNASWRIDQSNLFGMNKSAQNRPVYSIGGKWAMGREQFLQSTEWISSLDLRATYGVTGNAPRPGAAASKDILSAQMDPNYESGLGLIISTPANDKLTWESTKVYNAGIDFSLWSSRLSGSIDGYIKNTQDLIGVLNTAPLTGFPGVTGNFGDMQNKGIDISLNTMNIIGKDFFWSSGLTVGYNKNKITKLARVTPFSTGGQLIEESFLVGYPSFVMFGYNYAGLNATGDPQINLQNGTVSSDIDVSTPDDMLYMGTYQPVWSGGLSNSFIYKNIQLSFNISYNAGHKMFRDGNLFWAGVLYGNNAHPEFVNRWKQEGDEKHTDIPRYSGSNDETNSREPLYYHYANTNIFNASYIKLRDISVQYNLPDNAMKRLGAKALSFRFQVNNIMLWKANKLGIDPEFHHPHGGREMRFGQGQFTFGAHVTL
ncbi:TonB-linked outer membrane protein, SusC/RagA family [Sphingobacterium nematocida]|uniref:TonB-linked outer membrane protein, SusC/RagA family n=1 Tax=Sphingobacterium nematocida TaxID=1513896 RepID=A0A1T5AXK5_9SPHI|nr:SusC/RagA family TonB-linked outer membrane protein [Sphingobacterium nematocida]SKB39490.1 TonB-linked outer membrane protein, SusC/RagA family [Sphingobacterium nematocida]